MNKNKALTWKLEWHHDRIVVTKNGLTIFVVHVYQNMNLSVVTDAVEKLNAQGGK